MWSLWLQGWDAAPEIVAACRRTWETLNPAWSFQPLTRTTLCTMLDDRTMRFVRERPDVPPDALSDVVRIALLERFGGVWVDSTTYCLQPLDTWLSDVATTGFFAFDSPGEDRMVSSWFLAATPGNPIVKHGPNERAHTGTAARSATGTSGFIVSSATATRPTPNGAPAGMRCRKSPHTARTTTSPTTKSFGRRPRETTAASSISRPRRC